MKTKFKVLRQKVTTRGGGVEVDLSPFGYEGEKMTAYQNYLGGGMLGGIGNDCTCISWEHDVYLIKIAKELRDYFCYLMNDGDDYIDSDIYSGLPLSAY
tara:strand:- start:1729 stop:2025 length:297 start_codon:yes stop_codon:yes gene_type:complete